MPELPEVETYIRELAPSLQGRRVLRARVYWPGVIAFPTAEEFETGLAGVRFTQFARRGKYMLLGLDDPRTLIVHLRMTGKLFPGPRRYAARQTRACHLRFGWGESLHYQDPRKFGPHVADAAPGKHARRTGAGATRPDFTASTYQRQTRGTLSLHQGAAARPNTSLPGLANIYADEALYERGWPRAGPRAPARGGGPPPVRRVQEVLRSSN